MKLVLLQPQLSHADEENLERVRSALSSAPVEFAHDDIVLLPERFEPMGMRAGYEREMSELARSLGCHVVGGSHHEERASGAVNSGLVMDPEGRVIGRYDKQRPYANERSWVGPGSELGEIEIAGRHVLVLICADFWFSDLFARAERLPDVVLVPALSVTRKSTPDYSRALWRHLAVARAYEFGAYVGVSDWGYPSRLPELSASGVGGFADPTLVEPSRLFAPIGDRVVAVHELDFDRLAAFRQDRVERGFFWKKLPG
jgi:predicted amidohydrolase